jgi:NhaP-type Na+/H+ or K+/H+ antiporter
MQDQHILRWGGLRGALALALALALPTSFPFNNEILIATFGVVTFSVVVQGLTMPKLMKCLSVPLIGRQSAYVVSEAVVSRFRSAGCAHIAKEDERILPEFGDIAQFTW